MLTPGDSWLAVAGTGQEASRFWQAFFNPTYWPNLFMRTAGLHLAGRHLGAGHVQPHRRRQAAATEDRSWCAGAPSGWFPSFVLLPAAAGLVSVAGAGVAARAAALWACRPSAPGAFTQVTRTALVIVMTSATIVGVVYFLAWRSPLDFSFPHAVRRLCSALVATASGEYGREMLRKPYVIGRHMFSNGVRVGDVAAVQRGRLPRAFPVARTGDTPPLARGEAMFRGQCMACHTVDGYRLDEDGSCGRNREAIGNLLAMLHDYKPDSPYRRVHAAAGGHAGRDRGAGRLPGHLVTPAPAVPAGKTVASLR